MPLWKNVKTWKNIMYLLLSNNKYQLSEILYYKAFWTWFKSDVFKKTHMEEIKTDLIIDSLKKKTSPK